MKFNLTHIQMSNGDKRRNITVPDSPSANLAEFLGILTGDGYMNHYPYQNKYLIEIAGDTRLDNYYLCNYVYNLILELFNLKASVYRRKDQNSLYLRLISRGIYEFLLSIGFKSGKKEQIGIPQWIQSDENLMISFVKGLADTDFSIYFRKEYPIISVSLKSCELIERLFYYLKSKQFRLSNFYRELKVDKRGYRNCIIYKLRLNGWYNFSLWQKYIGFRNPRHNNKIKVGPVEFESTIQDQADASV